MSPTIVLDDGKPFLALGSPGGSTIITTVLQILVDRLDLGLTLPQAIAAPRASQRNTATAAEPAFINSPEGQALDRAVWSRVLDAAEIGAATGIEFLGGGRVLAAAEPSGAAEAARWWKSRNSIEPSPRSRQRSTGPGNRALPGTWSAASSAGPIRSRAS